MTEIGLKCDTFTLLATTAFYDTISGSFGLSLALVQSFRSFSSFFVSFLALFPIPAQASTTGDSASCAAQPLCPSVWTSANHGWPVLPLSRSSSALWDRLCRVCCRL